MKTKFAGLAVMFFVSGMLTAAKADSVSLFSSAGTTTNRTASPTQNIDMHPFWTGPLAGSSWVSYAPTGNPSDPDFVEVPNGTAVTFSATFTLSGAVTSAVLHVLADDTTNVVVNGTEIFPANLTGPYPVCSATPIGCLTSTVDDAHPQFKGTRISFIKLLDRGSNGLNYRLSAKAFNAPTSRISNVEPSHSAIRRFFRSAKSRVTVSRQAYHLSNFVVGDRYPDASFDLVGLTISIIPFQ